MLRNEEGERAESRMGYVSIYSPNGVMIPWRVCLGTMRDMA